MALPQMIGDWKLHQSKQFQSVGSRQNCPFCLIPAFLQHKCSINFLCLSTFFLYALPVNSFWPRTMSKKQCQENFIYYSGQSKKESKSCKGFNFTKNLYLKGSCWLIALAFFSIVRGHKQNWRSRSGTISAKFRFSIGLRIKINQQMAERFLVCLAFHMHWEVLVYFQSADRECKSTLTRVGFRRESFG